MCTSKYYVVCRFVWCKPLDIQVQIGVHVTLVLLVITRSKGNQHFGFHLRLHLMATIWQNLWTLPYAGEESVLTPEMASLISGLMKNMLTNSKMRSRMLAGATITLLLKLWILMIQGLIVKPNNKIQMSQSMSVLMLAQCSPRGL